MRIKLILQCVATLVFINSCSQPTISKNEEQDLLASVTKQIDLNSTAVRHEVGLVKTLLKKKKFDENELLQLERITQIYQTALALSNQEVLIPPRTKLSFDLQSLCLDLPLQAPSENEVYQWKKETPNIPFLPELLKRNFKVDQNVLQSIIWNITLHTHFENYPPKMQTILKEIDPDAEKTISARNIKSNILNKIENRLKSELGFDIIEGEFADYNQLSTSLSSRVASKISERQRITLVSDEEFLYTQSSGSFIEQRVDLYNSSDSLKRIKLIEYHLKPTRSEVQRLAIYASTAYYEKLTSTIREALKDAIRRNATYWYDTKNSISIEEMKLIQKYPIEALTVYIQAEKAKLSTRKYFLTSGENDESDAFRHFMWAGLVTQQLGPEMATEFLTAHEKITQSTPAAIEASKMDKHNNSIGIEAAIDLQRQNKLNWLQLEKEAALKVEDGALIINERKTKMLYPH